MLKKVAIIILLIFLTLFFSVFGLLFMSGYGGGDCDVTGHDCGCFCCHMFGLRGYESCGDFGFLAGAAIGIVISIIIFRRINKRR